MSTTPLTPRTFEDLESLVEHQLGPTEWLEVTQERITAFANSIDDHQWIHVDPERAAQGPFGGTIAHGVYVLSLSAGFMESLMRFDGFAHALNYGFNTVRFPAVVPSGSKIRMHAMIESVERVGDDAVQVVTKQWFEVEGSLKPVCVARSVGRFIGEAAKGAV